MFHALSYRFKDINKPIKTFISIVEQIDSKTFISSALFSTKKSFKLIPLQD